MLVTRRGKWFLAIGVALALVTAACAGSVLWLAYDAERTERSCTEQWQAFEKTVQDSRKWTDQEIPGIGDYMKVHWLGKAASNPCSRVPGPTDWSYQGFAQLRPQDAKDLQAGNTWQPQAPAEIWPELLPFAPTNAQWLHTVNHTDYNGDLYLDQGTGTLFFALLHG